MYFARLRSKTDTHIPPIAGQVWIPIVRHIRIMKRLAVILGSLARAIIRDARRGYENREFKHGTRFFRRVCPPTPRTRVVHPLLGVRRPGRSCVAVCLRAHGWPLRVRRDRGPVHTYRGDQHGDGERPVGWHGSCYAHVRALQRKGVRVARSVTKFTALALRCVQCTWQGCWPVLH